MTKFLAGVAVGSAFVGTVVATFVGLRNAYEDAMSILDNADTWAIAEDEPAT